MSAARLTPLARATVAPTRSAAYAASRPALFSTTVRRADKGPIEATKDTLKKADRFVSDAAVKGIEKGEEASHKIQEALGHESKADEAVQKGKEAAQKGKEAAQDAASKAKEKTVDLGEQARDEAEELTGKA